MSVAPLGTRGLEKRAEKRRWGFEDTTSSLTSSAGTTFDVSLAGVRVDAGRAEALLCSLGSNESFVISVLFYHAD